MNFREDIAIESEDTSKVMVNDLPRTGEYSEILYLAQECGKYIETDFKRSSEANSKAWRKITDIMAQCIARGMRLERNRLSSSLPDMSEEDNPYDNPVDRERPEAGMYSKYETFNAGAEAYKDNIIKEMGG